MHRPTDMWTALMTTVAVVLMGLTSVATTTEDEPTRLPRIDQRVECPKELNGVPVTVCAWPLDREQQDHE